MSEIEKETVRVIEPVKIVDVRMPFWSMVVFMIKWAIASIPAFFVLALIFSFLSFFVAGFMHGLGQVP